MARSPRRRRVRRTSRPAQRAVRVERDLRAPHGATRPLAAEEAAYLVRGGYVIATAASADQAARARAIPALGVELGLDARARRRLLRLPVGHRVALAELRGRPGRQQAAIRLPGQPAPAPEAVDEAAAAELPATPPRPPRPGSPAATVQVTASERRIISRLGGAAQGGWAPILADSADPHRQAGEAVQAALAVARDYRRAQGAYRAAAGRELRVRRAARERVRAVLRARMTVAYARARAQEAEQAATRAERLCGDLEARRADRERIRRTAREAVRRIRAAREAASRHHAAQAALVRAIAEARRWLRLLRERRQELEAAQEALAQERPRLLATPRGTRAAERRLRLAEQRRLRALRRMPLEQAAQYPDIPGIAPREEAERIRATAEAAREGSLGEQIRAALMDGAGKPRRRTRRGRRGGRGRQRPAR